MELVLDILDSVTKEFSIDSNRIYVAGQSMGGHGTWDIALRNSNKFAAAVPVCAIGDPSEAKRIAHLPVWIFHGSEDTSVPVTGSRMMARALKAVGSTAKFTEFEGIGHNSWEPAWEEKHLIPWLFQQMKKADGAESR